MALKAGLFGGDWEEYHNQQIQPLLDQYDQLIRDILASGAHRAIAEIQAQDDASGAGDGADNVAIASPAGANQKDGSWYNLFGTDSNSDNTPSFGTDHSTQSLVANPPFLSGSGSGPDMYVPTSAPSNNTDKGRLFGGLATAFGGTGLAADLASAGATSIGSKFGSGDTAVLGGLADTTRHIISTPLSVAEGVANTFKDVADGYTPAESILGNTLRSGAVYGGGALAGTLTGPLGGLAGIAAGAGLDYMLPSGGAIGRSILEPPPSKYDFPTTVMLRAK